MYRKFAEWQSVGHSRNSGPSYPRLSMRAVQQTGAPFTNVSTIMKIKSEVAVDLGSQIQILAENCVATVSCPPLGPTNDLLGFVVP